MVRFPYRQNLAFLLENTKWEGIGARSITDQGGNDER
jgi:hypothetical protein